jgi:hypothetical protein
MTTKTAPEKAKKKAKKAKVETLTAHIILDRSGSMGSNWQATIAGVNAYVENLAKDGVLGAVSLTVFDSVDGANIAASNGLPPWAGGQRAGNFGAFGAQPCIETIRTGIEIDDWTNVSALEVAPRGSTPLRDAVGQTLSKMRASGTKGKVAVVVMTDGYENASKEYTPEMVASLIKQCEADGWLITYLGANHDAWTQAKDLGFRAGTVANFTEQNVGATYATVSAMSASYTNSGDPVTRMAYSADDRKRMMGK